MRRPTRRIVIAATAIKIWRVCITAVVTGLCVLVAGLIVVAVNHADAIRQLQRTAPAAHVTDATPAPEQESPLIYECPGQPCKDGQEFTVFDAGTPTRGPAPIWSVPESGDVSSYGTGIAVTVGGTSFWQVVSLNTDGTVTVGGQVLTPADVALLNTLKPGELAFLGRLWCASLPRYQQQTCLTAVKR